MPSAADRSESQLSNPCNRKGDLEEIIAKQISQKHTTTFGFETQYIK